MSVICSMCFEIILLKLIPPFQLVDICYISYNMFIVLLWCSLIFSGIIWPTYPHSSGFSLALGQLTLADLSYIWSKIAGAFVKNTLADNVP